VSLQEEDRDELNRYLRRGKSSARSLTRARILLLADEGRSDEEIVESLKVSRTTVKSDKEEILHRRPKIRIA
jgi:DNA-binding NarL/FixJ family response regulator